MLLELHHAAKALSNLFYFAAYITIQKTSAPESCHVAMGHMLSFVALMWFESFCNIVQTVLRQQNKWFFSCPHGAIPELCHVAEKQSKFCLLSLEVFGAPHGFGAFKR